jgi:hypothetical protein
MRKAKLGKPSPRRGYKFTDEEKEKARITAIKYTLKGKDHPQSRRVLNKETGEIYDTVTQAAKKIGMKRSTLSMQLNGHHKNNSGCVIL